MAEDRIRDRLFQLHLTSETLIVLGDQRQRLVVEGDRFSGCQAASRLLGCSEQIADRALRVAGLPGVGQVASELRQPLGVVAVEPFDGVCDP